MSIPSIPSTIHKHDGHVEGHLNCVAIRHGWTRTFSMSPEEVANLEYQTLERILELSTLKLRSLGALRIYVENPANTRIFTKVRYWKDDGSLQSNLVKDFFEARMREGGILRFEVRDGRERAGGVLDEDATVAAESVGSEAPGSPTMFAAHKPLRKKSMSFDWFVRRGTPAPDDKNPKARGFLDIIVGFARGRSGTTTSASTEESEPLTPRAARAEEHAESAPETDTLPRSPRASLQQRVVRASASSPFFSASTTRTRTRPPTVRFKSDSGVALEPDGDVDVSPPRRSVPKGCFPEDVSPDPDAELEPALAPAVVQDTSAAPATAAAPTAAPSRLGRFHPFGQQQKEGGRKLKRRAGKRDKAEPPNDGRFRGADVVRRPEDAWAAVRSESALGHRAPVDEPTQDDDEVPSATARVVSIGNLLDDDQDPFRG